MKRTTAIMLAVLLVGALAVKVMITEAPVRASQKSVSENNFPLMSRVERLRTMAKEGKILPTHCYEARRLLQQCQIELDTHVHGWCLCPDKVFCRKAQQYFRAAISFLQFVERRYCSKKKSTK